MSFEYLVCEKCNHATQVTRNREPVGNCFMRVLEWMRTHEDHEMYFKSSKREWQPYELTAPPMS